MANASTNATKSTEDLMDTARQTYDRVVDKASEYVSGMNTNPGEFIRQYPLQAALGGVILGFLLGTAVSRRA